MLFGKSTIALVAAFAVANGAVIDLFSDHNCGNPAGSRNVFDNTCAPLGGFSSFKITTAGGRDQQITAYSRNACAGPYNACVSASSVGVCYTAYSSDGGSNAISSSSGCGIA